MEFLIGKEKVECVKIHIIHSVQHDDTGRLEVSEWKKRYTMWKVIEKSKNAYLNIDLVDFKIKLQGTKSDIIL